MATHKSKNLTDSQIAQRQQRVAELAARFGFTGIVEYRHVVSRSGGAQFCLATVPSADCLLVYAEAFVRDLDPGDFSLSAMIAHECGHQRLLRDPKLAIVCQHLPGVTFEEVLASLIGSLLVDDRRDAKKLVAKATYDLATLKLSSETINRTIAQVRGLLEGLIR